jgi:hypothetical protein
VLENIIVRPYLDFSSSTLIPAVARHITLQNPPFDYDSIAGPWSSRLAFGTTDQGSAPTNSCFLKKFFSTLRNAEMALHYDMEESIWYVTKFDLRANLAIEGALPNFRVFARLLSPFLSSSPSSTL